MLGVSSTGFFSPKVAGSAPKEVGMEISEMHIRGVHDSPFEGWS